MNSVNKEELINNLGYKKYDKTQHVKANFNVIGFSNNTNDNKVWSTQIFQ